jgi:predicted carbohydrate-binding protein with CBM5 and CBM33 domain
LNIARRLAVLGAAALVGVGGWLVAAPTVVGAHGVALIPGSRTYLCYVDGLQSTGQIIPNNPACADAVAQGGTQPLYDWFGVLRSDAGGRTVGFIPDGQICGGDTTKYAAYNAARTDWPVTHLTAGSTITVHYSNWARHPGTFHVYVTRDGWSPTTPLAWADLVPIWSATDPPESGPAGSLNYYSWDMQLPTGKSGRHILYIQWVRSDSQENFFSCSDVAFDGGHGEVTGVGPGGGPTPSPSTPPPSSPAPSTPPSSPPPGNGGTCVATWQATSTGWPGHFQGTVTVQNPGTSGVNGWTVRWTYQHGEGFEGAPWNGTLTGQPPDVAVRNVDWNRVLPPGGTTSFGFNATGAVPATPPVLSCTGP